MGRAVDFPDLDEATTQLQNPELFTYIRSVEDVIAKLLTGKSVLLHLPIAWPLLC